MSGGGIPKDGEESLPDSLAAKERADRLAARPLWRELDLDALAVNLKEAERRAGPGRTLIASIKANAYGHGAVAVARKLDALGVKMLATGSFDDAVAIRRAGIGTRIEMFAGALPQAMAAFLAHDLTPTVHSRALAEAVSAAASKPTPVHIKVDGGLGRIGVPFEEAEAFVDWAAALPNLEIEAIYSHIPFASADGKAWAEPRVRRFEALIDRLAARGHRPPLTEVIASSGLQVHVSSKCTAVCPGHMLYGVATGAAGYADEAGLAPVLTAIRARLIHTLHFAEAAQVGSGGGVMLPAGGRIGVVPFGMHDGYRPAVAGERLEMLFRGRRVPVLGVSMEHTTVDLTSFDAPETGETVTVLGVDGGERIGLREIAQRIGQGQTATLLNFSDRLQDG